MELGDKKLTMHKAGERLLTIERKVAIMFGRLVIVTVAIFGLMVSQSAVADELDGTLKKIKESGVIVMGYREESKPFSYIGAGGDPIGYTIDLCYRIIDKIKERYDLPDLEIEMMSVTPDNRIPLLEDGTIDIECGSTTNTLERQERISFLAITFFTGTRLAVKKGAGISEIEDLEDKTIVLTLGTTNEKVIMQLIEDSYLKIEFELVEDHAQAWDALESGRVDAYALDEVLLFGYLSEPEKLDKFEVIGRSLSYEPYGIMVRRGDAAMQLIGNTALAELMRSGEIRKIYNNWFNPGPTNINMPISSKLKTAFDIQALPEGR